jgi:hypothetical protein
VKKSQRISAIKRACFLLLLISFFLPMAKSCSKVEIPNTTGKPFFNWVNETPETKYIRDILPLDTPLSDQLIFLILVFFWPVPFIFLPPLRRKHFLYLRMAGELFFGTLGAYLYILPAVFLGEFMIGGYLYLSVTGIYLGTTLVELWQTILLHFKRRQVFSSAPTESSGDID